MKNAIVVWLNKDENVFEANVPLKFAGQRNKISGFSNNVNLLFLNGFDLLSDAYKDSLSGLGYLLHDVSNLYIEFDKKYSELSSFPDYEKKCFLRWLVVDKFFSGEKIFRSSIPKVK